MKVASELVLVFVLAAAPVNAQPLSSFADLASKVNLGDTVMIRDQTGRRAHGRLREMSSAAVVVDTPSGPRRFSGSEVSEVAVRGDDLRNGTLIGLGIGAALGVGLAGWFSGEFRGGDAVAGALLFGGIGAGLGVAVDAAIRGNTVVYRSARTVAVVPVAGPRSIGVTGTITW